MERCLKTTTCLLLFVHLAAQTTDSPGRTLDKAWLREPPKKLASLNSTTEEEDASTMDSSSGGTSGFTVADPEEELNVIGQNNNTTDEEFPEATTPAAATASLPANTSLVDATTDDNSTTTPPAAATKPVTHNSTGLPEPQPTAVATRAPTPELTNGTESNATTANAATPQLNGTSSAGSASSTSASSAASASSTSASSAASASSTASTPLPLETTDTGPWTTTSTAVDTPAKANETDKDAAVGERGFASDPPRSRRHAQWAAVLGTMLAVTVAGLVAYAVLRTRRHKGFSHRKLVEEYPSDPVLRLDNSEPLDLNFGGSSYDNAGLQGDSIQMTNFPGRP